MNGHHSRDCDHRRDKNEDTLCPCDARVDRAWELGGSELRTAVELGRSGLHPASDNLGTCESRIRLSLMRTVERASALASLDASHHRPWYMYTFWYLFCATVVAALSVISFPAGALMLNSAASGDASSVSSRESAVTSAPVLSPDGKPVRVISLSASVRPGEVSANSTAAEMSRPAVADLASTAAISRDV
jgi:hypothetical protein